MQSGSTESLAEGVAMPVNPAGLIDADLRASLSQMAQENSTHAKAMTDQVNWQNVKMKNLLVRSKATG